MCHCSALQFPSSQEVWKAASGTTGGEVCPGRLRARPAGCASDSTPFFSHLPPRHLPTLASFSVVQQVSVEPGAVGMACVDSVPALKVLLGDQWLALYFLKSHGGGGQSTKWDHVSLKHYRGHLRELIFPQVYLQRANRFTSRLHLDGSLTAINKLKLCISQVSCLNFTRPGFHQSATRGLALKRTC